MEPRRCARCGGVMQKRDYGFYHCSCGTSWMSGKGYFTRTPDMECTFEERVVDGVTVREPIIRYHKNPHNGAHIRTDDIVRVEKMMPKPTVPFQRDAEHLIRGGIYMIRDHRTEGHEIRSGRPAVIVSSVSEGYYKKIVTVVYLTSRDKRFSKTRTIVTSSGRVSTALIDQISTVDVSRVGAFIGICSVKEMNAIKNCMRVHLAIHNFDENPYPEGNLDDYIQQLQAENFALQSQIRELLETIRELKGIPSPEEPEETE